MTIVEVLQNLCSDPMSALIRRWNWKSAFLSSLFRGVLFFCANLTAGWHAAVGAMVTECCYRGVTAGCYGALTQSFCDAEPAWAATLVALILLPLASHSVEFGVHSLRHTPHLALSCISSVSFTVFSTLFHLYAMKRGALVVRDGANSLAEDMSLMPRLIFGFIIAGPVTTVRYVKRLGYSWAPSRPETNRMA